VPSGAVERALTEEPLECGQALLSVPEDQWYDRKSNRLTARDLGDAIVGFANAEGGCVVIGLWNGCVEGVDSFPSRINDWRQAALDFTEPTVHIHTRLFPCFNDEGVEDSLFVVDVDQSDFVHSNKRDEVFLRVGDENRRLTFHQRQELTYDKGQASFEGTVVAGATAAELDTELIDSYAGSQASGDAWRLLQARGLMTTDEEITVAGYLLFAEHPQARFPEASVRLLRYLGTERGSGARQRLAVDHRLDGPIPNMLVHARERLLEMVPRRRALRASGRFEDAPIVPEDALIEGLVNAVVHRSYSMTGDHVRIEVFDDRVEIESPGRFPGVVDLGDPLAITRFARNPRIARVCADLRFGQELGEGIRRMFEEMRLAGLVDPGYRQTSGSVHLVLASEPEDRALEAALPRGARDLIRVIREMGRASTGELVEQTGISRPVVLRNLRALQDVGVIEWIGNSKKDPRAFWRLRVE
jgi:ATP-dependent DNA helicase RecG